MNVSCKKCGNKQNVHGGHFWRYRRRFKCKGCGLRGFLEPDEDGKEEIKSRNKSIGIFGKRINYTFK